VLSEEAQSWSAKGTMRNRGVAFVSSISGLMVPRPVDSAIAGPERAKNLAGKNVLRLIQIRLATPIFEKISQRVK